MDPSINSDSQNTEDSQASTESSVEYIPKCKKPRLQPRSDKSPVPSILSSLTSMTSSDFNTKIPIHVSKWKIVNLDMLGVHYDKAGPIHELDELVDKTSSYLTSVLKLGNDFTNLSEFLNEFLTFDVSNCKDYDNVDRFKQDISKIYNDLNRLEKLSIADFLVGKSVSKNNDLNRMFENVHIASIDFLNGLIQLMEEEFKDQQCCCYEMVYRMLYANLFNSCCLKTQNGECYKKCMGIFSGEHIQSKPDLRCLISKKLFYTSLKRTVLMIGEIKRRKQSTIESENFSIERDLGKYDILGQHGGDLLVELSDSCFRKKDGSKLIFGAICVATQIIFTALEMKEEVYEKITNSDALGRKHHLETTEKSYIYYTKPYDILKSSDRNKLYKPLIRLACVQNEIKH